MSKIEPPFSSRYRVFSAGPGGVIPPDLVGHHYGYQGYRLMWQAMLEGFEDLTLVPEELLDLGDRSIIVIRLTGHGSSSRVPIDQLRFQVYTYRRGLVVRKEDFAERERALEGRP